MTRRLTPTKEQLERIDDFRAATYGKDADHHTRASLVKLAALLGLPKPHRSRWSLIGNHFHYTGDDDDHEENFPTATESDYIVSTDPEDVENFERRDERMGDEAGKGTH